MEELSVLHSKSLFFYEFREKYCEIFDFLRLLENFFQIVYKVKE